MRRLIAIAALARGMAVMRAAILPLTAQQVSAAASPTMWKALFFCRRPHRIDQTCAIALTKALLIDLPKRDAACRHRPGMPSRLADIRGNPASGRE